MQTISPTIVVLILLILIFIIIVVVGCNSNQTFQINKAFSQETPQLINVDVVTKTPQHPFFGKGSPLGFSINGTQGAPLNLKRNVEYTFVYNNSGHPFYFSSSEEGDHEGAFKIPNTVDPFTTTTKVTFDSSTQGGFFYACSLHSYMGGTVTLM